MIYLDNSATTRVWDGVIEEMSAAMREAFFNPSSLYAPALLSKDKIKHARTRLLDAAKAKRLVFTSGGTEADNLAIFGVAQALRGKKRRFVCSAVEHPGVLAAMARLEQEGHEVLFAPVDAQGCIDVQALQNLINEDTALVSIMQVNNETGAVSPLRQVSQAIKAKNPNALLHVDGVQGFLRVPTNMQADGIDLYSLSGHKIHGPKGIGALLLGDAPLRLLPQMYGGGQESGLRSGTENVPGIVGLGAAVEQYQRLQNPSETMMEMKRLLHDQILQGVPEAKRNGPPVEEGAPHILNMSFPLRGETLLHALEGEGILVSTGSACSNLKKTASHVLKAMKLPDGQIEGSVRFSLSPDNTKEEMAAAAEAVVRQVGLLKRFVRR